MLYLDIAKTIDWTKPDAIEKKMASYATKSDDTVADIIASLFFVMGLQDKETPPNEPRKLGVLFNAFASKHWTTANGRQPLKATSAANYASAFAGYYRAARMPYDGAIVATFALDTLKGSFSNRGATMNKILDAYPTVAPTVEQMHVFAKKEASDTARSVATASLKKLTSAFGDGGTFMALLMKHPQADLALADAMGSLQAALKYLPADDAGETDDLAARAAAKRAAIKASTTE
jgi:hypothetical protein